MHKVRSRNATAISYETYGHGPPMVLVHGSFSDHRTNWNLVLPYFEKQFTVFTMARRGRGETDETEGHSVEDEQWDAAAVIQSVGESVFLLGHSYGAHVALGAAGLMPDNVRKLVLYEAPWPHIIRQSCGRSSPWLRRTGGTTSRFHFSTASFP